MHRHILLVTTICALLAILPLSQVYQIKTVSIGEDFVMEQVSKRVGKDLPIKGLSKLAIKKASLRSVDTRIEDGKVNIFVKLTGELAFGPSFSLVSSAVGIPSYSNGSFYFQPDRIEVQDFSIEGQQTHAEKWMTPFVEAAAMQVLDKQPVYRLKDDVKGFILQSTLTSIKAVGNHIELTFRLWQITMAVLVGIFLIIVSLSLALMLFIKMRAGKAACAAPHS